MDRVRICLGIDQGCFRVRFGVNVRLGLWGILELDYGLC